MKVGIIGLGKMGLLHAGLLGSMKDVQLVAMCDKKKLLTHMAKDVLKKKLTVVDDIMALSNIELDAIYITTPIPSHYPIIDAIYRNKLAKHVFVEKTLAANWKDAQNLCKTAKDSGGINMVGYQKRYSVTFQKGYELIKEQAIGNINDFKAYSYSSDFVNVDKEKAKELFSSRGSVINDLGSHAINLALWYFNDLSLGQVNPSEQNFGTASFSVNAGDVAGTIEASWCKKEYRLPEIGLIICGEKGNLHVNDDIVKLQLKDCTNKTWFRQDLDDSVDFVLWAPEYYREDRSFVESILTNRKAQPDFAEASQVDYIIEEVNKKLC